MQDVFSPWFHYPALGYAYFLNVIGIVSHGVFIRQFLRDRSFRSRYNFFCLWRSIMNIAAIIISLYSYNVAVISRQSLYSDFILPITFSISIYLMGSEVVLALNRFSVIVFWRSYDLVFTKRNSMIFACSPLIGSFIVLAILLTHGCQIELCLDVLDYEFEIADGFCVQFSHDLLYLYGFIFLATLCVNIITSVVLIRLTYNNSRKGNSSIPSHTSRNIRSFIHSFTQLLLWTLILLDYGFIDVESFPYPFLGFMVITSAYGNRATIEGLLLVIFNWKSIRSRNVTVSVNPTSRTF
ncbi:unnamed protein product [Auanema sp. JU1783]|nr:unnamed protein product [Auanema sp. JU1783]